METISPSVLRPTSSVKSMFIELKKRIPIVVNSPGRINLIGEHTDYNNGFVMPAAINRTIQIAMAISDSDQSSVYSVRYGQSFDIDIKNPQRIHSPTWANYFLGIVSCLKSKGHLIDNFDCVFDGNLPTGAGLSSSAALECGFIFGLNELFRLRLGTLDMIRISQWAEHNYAGVKCGIMDQFASMMGRRENVILLDCRDLSYQYFPLHLQDYCLLLCDTNVKHALASSEYNTRRHECERGVTLLRSRFPEIESLRDVSKQMLKDNAELFDATIYKRCLYVIEENERTVNGAADLRQGNLAAFGQKMYDTHKGLATQYEVSCSELDFLVAESRKFDGIIGARMMGGGFGGCTLNLIRRDVVEVFLSYIKSSYYKNFRLELTSHIVEIANGTSIE